MCFDSAVSAATQTQLLTPWTAAQSEETLHTMFSRIVDWFIVGNLFQELVLYNEWLIIVCLLYGFLIEHGAKLGGISNHSKGGTLSPL